MKYSSSSFLALALTLAPSGFGQGTLIFHNRIDTVDARVVYFSASQGGWVPVDSQFVGQLYASVPGGTLAPVGNPIPFRDSPEAGRGYLNTTGIDTTRVIPGVPEGGTAQAKMVVWASALGATYEQALMAGQGNIGESATITVDTGGGLVPPKPLLGLQSFSVSLIPEPSPAQLGLLGVGLLLLPSALRRRAD